MLRAQDPAASCCTAPTAHVSADDEGVMGAWAHESETLGDTMVLDPAGQIHVLDHQAREVRTFGSDGRHLRSFGGRGQGPGEFTDPDAMRLLPDGRLVIRDQQGGRFSIFDSDGSCVDSWPIRSGFITSTPFQ